MGLSMTPINCPHCQKQTCYLPEFEGKVMGCPHCGGHILMKLSGALPVSGAPVASSPVSATPAMQIHVSPKPSTPAAGKNSALVLGVSAFVVLGFVSLVAAVTYLVYSLPVNSSVAKRPVETNRGVSATSIRAESSRQEVSPPLGATTSSSADHAVPSVHKSANTRETPPAATSRASAAPLAADSSRQPFRAKLSKGRISELEEVSQPEATGLLASGVPAKPAVQPPLSKTAKFVELPTLASSDVERLSDLDHKNPAEVRLRLISLAADIPDRAAIFTERSKDQPLRWEVSYTPNLEAESPESVLLGAFVVGVEGLSFGWSEPFADPTLRRQLKNCVLTLETDKQRAHIALRPPVSAEAIKIDLSKDKALQQFAVVDLPKKSRVFAEVQGAGFPIQATAGRLVQTLGVGPDEATKFDRLTGAELGLRLATTNDGLNLTIAPRFREKGQVFALSRSQLEATKKGSETARVNIGNKLDEAAATIESCNKAIQRLPSATPGSPAAVQRDIRLSQLQATIKRESNNISRLKRQIPAVEARLKAVPEISAFLDTLEGRELNVQMYADCGEFRLPLVVAGKMDDAGQTASAVPLDLLFSVATTVNQ
jgi:hypothetical protein